MKNLIYILVACFLLSGCGEDKTEHKQVKTLNDLATLRVQSIAIAHKSYGTDRLLLRAKGDAFLGVDLSQAEYKPKTLVYTNGRLNDDQTLTISLPSPKVVAAGIIEGTRQTIAENRSFWTSADTFEKEITDELEKELERQIRLAAEDQELIKSAKRKAETLIKAFHGKTHPDVAIVINWNESNEEKK